MPQLLWPCATTWVWTLQKRSTATVHRAANLLPLGKIQPMQLYTTMPITTPATTLPESWQHWLQENLQRGCDPQTLLDTLRTHGFGDTIDQTAQALEASVVTQPWAGLARSIRAAGVNHLPMVDDVRPRVRMQLAQPAVVLLDDVVSLDECDALIALAGAQLAQSTVVDEQSGDAVPDPRRRSASTSFGRGAHEVVSRIEARMGQWLDYPVSRLEGMQILCYQPGGEYRPHFDFFDPALGGSARHLARGGQRVMTVIVYLSDVEAGGGTALPEIGLTVQPHQGSAVCFLNVHDDGSPDRRTLHAGLPVIAGCKYIATLWWREADYT